jgi:hypothetical protein
MFACVNCVCSEQSFPDAGFSNDNRPLSLLGCESNADSTVDVFIVLEAGSKYPLSSLVGL